MSHSVPQPSTDHSRQGLHLPFGQRGENLLKWRDPKASGATLVAAGLVYALVNSRISFAWLLSSCMLTVVVGVQTWCRVAPMLNRAGPPLPRILLQGISVEEAARFATSARRPINRVLAVLGAVLTGKDAPLSGLVIGVLTLTTWVFRYVSLSTLIFSVIVLAFTLPLAYEKNKAKVDHMAASLQAKSKDVFAQVEAKVKSSKPAKKTT